MGDARLDDRVIDLLLDHPGSLAFNGLRRALHAHPEALSRALRRLERDGLVRRGRQGYSAVQSPGENLTRNAAAPATSVAEVDLPAGVSGDEVFGLLAGRWFGGLRWLGIHELPEDPTLVWSVGDGRGHVLLSVRRGTLHIRVDVARGTPAFPILERAAYDLLRYALARIDRTPADPTMDPAALTLSMWSVGPLFAG